MSDDAMAARRADWTPLAYTTGVLATCAKLAQGAQSGAITEP